MLDVYVQRALVPTHLFCLGTMLRSMRRLLLRCVHSRSSRIKPASPEEICNQTLVRASNRGELTAALAVFRDIVDQGYTPGQAALGRLLHLCQRQQDMEGFDHVSHFIEDAGVELNESLGNMLIHGFVTRGRGDGAKKIFREMQARGLKVRVGVVNSLLSSWLEDCDVESCTLLLKLLQGMKCVPQGDISARALQLAREIGVKGQPLAHTLMQVYRSAEQLVPSTVAQEMANWLKQQPEKYVVSDSTIDQRGTCSCCGATLEDSSLSVSEHKELLAYADQQLTAEANSFLNNQPELYEIQNFRRSLSKGDSFSAVLDGLNVAHVFSARSNVNQLFHVAGTVRDKLGGPVLIIARKHLAAKILPGHPPVEINHHFKHKGLQFFFTQNRVAEDHYFLYGSLVCGRSTYFVSNDLLGDHTAHSVPAELVPVFKRWQTSRQVTMDPITHSQRRHGSQVTLKFPVVYRTVLQWREDMSTCHVPIQTITSDSPQWMCAS